MGSKIYADNSYQRVSYLGNTTYASRDYEPQTQNTFAFQLNFDKLQAGYIAARANAYKSPILFDKSNNLSTDDYMKALSGINEYLNRSLQSVGSPTKNIAQIVIDHFNSQIKFAGKPTYGTANITINTLVGLNTKNIFSAWSELCLNDRNLRGNWARSNPNMVEQAGAFNSAVRYTRYLYENNNTAAADWITSNIGYKCDCKLLECARDGSIINAWDYLGVWVSAFTPGSYNMAGSSSPSQITATLTVDQIMPSADVIFTGTANVNEVMDSLNQRG